MANEIVWFDSSETGAPTLNNGVGASAAAIAVLDACLITGFNPRTLTSIVVSGGVATATLAGHGYADGRMVDISGATPSGLNGRKKITVTSASAFTFPAPGIGDGSASGTITAKRSPLGWTKAYSATGKAAYARTDVAATAMLLRVDDTGSGVAAATYARVTMYESMTDIDTGSGVGPTAGQLSGGAYLGKGANSGAAKPWVLIGDSRTFYLLTDNATFPFTSYPALDPHGFGDFASFRPGDPYACMLAGADGANGTTWLSAIEKGSGTFSAALVAARPANGIGSATRIETIGPVFSGPSSQFAGVSGPTYPSGVDNGMVIQYPTLMHEDWSAQGNPLRGTLRGVAFPLASLGSRLDRQILSGVAGSGGRDFLAVAAKVQNVIGCLLFDITGPW